MDITVKELKEKLATLSDDTILTFYATVEFDRYLGEYAEAYLEYEGGTILTTEK